MDHPLKPGLEQPTPRIAKLPVAENGYPVPWFVDWIDGKPEFRAMDPEKWLMAVRWSLCWVCGERLGAHKTFVAGPMCGINRTSAEPPSHHDCALWSVRNCPFLSNPKMVRNEKGMEDAVNPAGIMIKRNPGVTMLWTTKKYTIHGDGRGGRLIGIGDPLMVEWYTCGKPSTWVQVMDSIESGIDALYKMAVDEGPWAVKALHEARIALMPLLPGERR